jgi:hypothetical protein
MLRQNVRWRTVSDRIVGKEASKGHAETRDSKIIVAIHLFINMLEIAGIEGPVTIGQFINTHVAKKHRHWFR